MGNRHPLVIAMFLGALWNTHAATVDSNPYGSAEWQVAELPSTEIVVRFVPKYVRLYTEKDRLHIEVDQAVAQPSGASAEIRIGSRGDRILRSEERVYLDQYMAELWDRSTWDVVKAVWHKDLNKPFKNIAEAPISGLEFAFDYKGATVVTMLYHGNAVWKNAPVRVGLKSQTNWQVTWKAESLFELLQRQDRERDAYRRIVRDLPNQRRLAIPGSIHNLLDLPGDFHLRNGIPPRGYVLHLGVLYWIAYIPNSRPVLNAYDGSKVVNLSEGTDPEFSPFYVSRQIVKDRGYLYACGGRGDGCLLFEGWFIDFARGKYWGLADGSDWQDYLKLDTSEDNLGGPVVRSDERYFAARRGALLGRLRFLKTEGGKKKWTSWVVENNGLETRKLFEAPFVGQSLESYGDSVVMNARGNIVYYGRLWKNDNDFDEYELVVQDVGTGKIVLHSRVAKDRIAEALAANGVDPDFPDTYSLYPQSLNMKGKSSVETLRIRSSPSLGGSIIGVLKKDDMVLVVRKTDTPVSIDGMKSPWYFIRARNGTAGWVFGGYVSSRGAGTN